jgi:nitroimidazol reductase NimA-like FMN-containing flavoprotein (pyridoxamine 5'-phosphate oxidase superfamily)
MVEAEELGAIARRVIDSNQFMTIGTADEEGFPWASPVWYAVADYREFFWVSSPEARHSRNIAVRPQVAIVIFDSRAPEGTAQAVYVAATAEELAGEGLERGIGIFSRASAAAGGELSEWQLEDVRAPYRLYRATATEHWVLDPESSPDRRAPVVLE